MNDGLLNSLKEVSSELIQPFHDLALLWVKANTDAAKLSPEEFYLEYMKTYDKIVAADNAARKGPDISVW